MEKAFDGKKIRVIRQLNVRDFEWNLNKAYADNYMLMGFAIQNHKGKDYFVAILERRNIKFVSRKIEKQCWWTKFKNYTWR